MNNSMLIFIHNIAMFFMCTIHAVPIILLNAGYLVKPMKEKRK